MDTKNNITLQTFDYIGMAIASFILIASWCYVIISYPNLPETIAVHFNGSGQPNGYNSKSTIWIAPILFTTLTIGFMYGTKNPDSLNIPYKKLSFIEKKISAKTMLFTSILLSCLLFLISLSMIETSLNRNFPTKWIVPTIVALIVIYLLGVFYYNFKYKKS